MNRNHGRTSYVGPHVLAPFAIEDGGRLGAHDLELLMAMSNVNLEKDRRTPFAYHAHAFSAPTLASMYVDPTLATPLVHMTLPCHFQARP